MTNKEIGNALASLMQQMLDAQARFVAEGHSEEAASREVIRQAKKMLGIA